MDITQSTDPGTEPPLACTLSVEGQAKQLLEWSDLRSHSLAVTSKPAGVEMTFSADLADEINDLAQREQACCSFLTIDQATENGVLTLSITAERPDAQAVIAAIAGTATPADPTA